MMNNNTKVLVAVVVAVLVVLSAGPTAEAVTCDVRELSPCYFSVVFGAGVSGACCLKLREQRPCFCGYIRDPLLHRFVASPNLMKVGFACRVAYPKCKP